MALRFLNSGYFAGKVGIGTASPVAKLDVLGTSGGPTVFDYQYATNAGVRIHGDESAMDIVGTDSGNHASTILLRNGNEGFGLLNNPNLNTLQFRSFTASADGFAIHNTGSGLSSLVDIITLEKTGNVGIGETNPGNTLHVKKNATIGVITSPTVANAGFRVQDSGANMYVDGNSFVIDTSGYLTTTGSNDFDIGTNSTSRIKIKGGGNVGIGILDPLAKLHIDVVDEDNQPGFKLTKVSDSGENAMEVHHGTSSVLRGIADFTNNNGSVMFLRGDGYVGIGTTSPGKKLDVNGDVYINSNYPSNAAASDLTIGKTTTGDHGLTIVTGASNTAGIFFADNNNNDAGRIKYQHSNNSMRFETNRAESMRITSAGNVGIGTTTPDFGLEVDGTFGVSDLPFNTDSVSVLVADEILGNELITNGDFSASTGWGVGSGWAIANGKASVNTSSTVGLTQSISVTSGNVYKVSVEVSNYTSGSLQPQFGGGQVIASISANGKYVYTVTSTITNPVFYLYAVNVADFSVDNVSVKQVTSASNQIQKRELSTGAFANIGDYLPLAGGTMTGDLKLNNSVRLKLGTSSNTSIYNDGTDTYIQQTSGNLYLWQSADDKDIIFASDNGSGGVAAYFQLDGSHTQSIAWKDIHFVDGIKAKFGDYASPDLEIYHDGSNSYIRDQGSGNLIITGSQLTFSNVADTEYMVKMVQDGTVELYYNGSKKLETTSAGVTVTGEIQLNTKALLSNQENTDVDTGAEVVAQVSTSTYTAAFFDFVIKKVGNIRSGTVYACHDGTNVEFTETSTNDLGDTSDVTLSVDISGTNMRLLATVTSDDWSVKSLIRAI